MHVYCIMMPLTRISCSILNRMHASFLIHATLCCIANARFTQHRADNPDYITIQRRWKCIALDLSIALWCSAYQRGSSGVYICAISNPQQDTESEIKKLVTNISNSFRRP